MKLILAAISFVLADVKDVKVSAPTRLDWQFAAHGFKDGDKPLGNYDSTKQKYQLFVPAKAGKGCIVFISAGDSPAGLDKWKPVCEKEGLLFCSPYGAGNDVPAAKRMRVILDMLDDVRRRHGIDANQTYIGGISGGGRVACTVGFCLPEYFGGVVPVCGTNPFSGPTYLRHRVHDRLSAAFVTGETDFNRKENEDYMAPYFADLGIRTKLWIAPKVGHAVPGPDVLAEVVAWLKEDLKRRREDVKLRPKLAVSPKEGPTAAEQARNMLDAAQAELKQPERIWHGVALLQGTAQRWTKTEPGKRARELLRKITEDPKMLEAVAQQGGDDEKKSLTAQARAFERFGQLDQAIRAWELLAQNYVDTPVGRDAETQIIRLRARKAKD